MWQIARQARVAGEAYVSRTLRAPRIVAIGVVMEIAEHEKYGKKILAYLVSRIKVFGGGNKSITYGELAKEIDYPEPHIGNLFGNNIGETLGVMGHMLDGLVIDDWHKRVPYIQTLVVGQGNGLPSNGLSEFEKDYSQFNTDEKKAFVLNEYENIFNFGDKWQSVLSKLGIEEYPYPQTSSGEQYSNPYGSEGSPEHRKLKEFVMVHGHFYGYRGNESGIEEYPLRSGDFIDVVFRDDNQVLGIEVKSIRSGTDDLERGIYQCIKYKAVLEAEKKITSRMDLKVECVLVIECDMPNSLAEVASKLGIKVYKEIVNK